MKKRHEIIAVLAAAAGLSIGSAADAAVTQHLNHPAETVLAGQDTMSDQMLSRMIQLAEAKGHDRSGNSDSGKSSGNGRAKDHDRSDNPNAAGGRDKQDKGKVRGKDDDHDEDSDNEDDDENDDDHDHHHNPS